MAITAATAAYDAIVRRGPGKSVFEDGKAATTSSSTWLQGDLICLDTSGHYLRRVAATGDYSTFVGIADNSVTSGKLAGPYDGLTAVDAVTSGPGFCGPKYGVVASLKLKTSDAFNIGDKVYLCNGSDTQTVTSTDPGSSDYIGIFQGPANVASAAAGQRGHILVVAQYPAISIG